jgi:hypothetical protein
VTAHLRLAAVTVGRTNTALGAFYRRLAARIGKAKAVTATARKIAILFYNAMRFGMNYQDPGADHYERTIRNKAAQRQMIYALGKKLADKGTDGIRGWGGWLQQFVKDGALSADQAAAFTAQAEAIHS